MQANPQWLWEGGEALIGLIIKNSAHQRRQFSPFWRTSPAAVLLICSPSHNTRALMASVVLTAENLPHACLGLQQLNCAINHLLYPPLLAFSLAPRWLQFARSIIKQIKADCLVNFHPVFASGGRTAMQYRWKTSWNETGQNETLAKNVWAPRLFPDLCLWPQFYAALRGRNTQSMCHWGSVHWAADLWPLQKDSMLWETVPTLWAAPGM